MPAGGSNPGILLTFSRDYIRMETSPTARRLICPWTLPLALISLYVLVVANLIGHPSVAWSGSLWTANHFGWPETYSTTALSPSQYAQARHIYLHRDFDSYVTPAPSPLHVQPEPKRDSFSMTSLVYNAWIALLIILGVIACAQCWQRSSRTNRRFGLRHALGMTACAACYHSLILSGPAWHFFYCNYTVVMISVLLSSIVAGLAFLVVLVLRIQRLGHPDRSGERARQIG